ncbi:MAG: BON domain-containing protein [Oceanipulchritudo sp.]
MKTKTSVNHPFLTLVVMGTALLAPLAGLASQTDDRIESSLKDTYVFKTFLKEDSIKVQSTDGVVVLTGTVKDGSSRSLAEETAGNLPGVISIDNQLEVAADSPPEYSDDWITLKVKMVLMFHRNVSALGTQVTTENAIVILRGEAPSAAHRELATEYARDVKGVKAVRNEMTIAVVPTVEDSPVAEKIDDASITAQVKTSLKTHQSTSAANTEVHTMDGVVTVGGVAENAAEKSLVSKLANDINGVTKVINDMTLKVAAK